jgi:two-component system sensor histidine kinase RegB
MAQGAGTVGESVAPCTVGALLDEMLVGIRAEPKVLRELDDDVAQSSLRLPPRAVSQALRSLITNAQDASPSTSAVVLTARREADELAVVIRDRGAGIPDEVMARIGEPFFTTKAPGRGMGLGLFLARAVIEGVGGSLEIDSQRGGGTEVRVRLPADAGARTASMVPVRSSESTAPRAVSKPA